MYHPPTPTQAPPIGYYPAAADPRETNTAKGLNRMSICLTLLIISYGLLMLILIISIPALMSISNDPANVDVDTMLAGIMALVGAMCLIILFIFIGAIFGLIALISLYSGKSEFGPEHERRVANGVVLIVISFLISIVLGQFGTYASAVGGVASAAMMGVGFVNIVYVFLDEKWKKIIWVGVGAHVAVSVVSSIATIILLAPIQDALAGNITDTTDFNAMWGNMQALMLISMGLSSLVLAPMVVYFLSVKRAYRKIISGEIAPVLPPSFPAAYGGMMPYYGQPGYQPYGVQYPPQPGQQPYQPHPGQQYPPQPGQQPQDQQPGAGPGFPQTRSSYPPPAVMPMPGQAQMDSPGHTQQEQAQPAETKASTAGPPEGTPEPTRPTGPQTLGQEVTCPNCQTRFPIDPKSDIMRCPGCGITGKIEGL